MSANGEMRMENKDKIILHLCADIGSDTKYYQEAGYDVRLVGRKIGVENFHPPDNVYGIIANPPCTHFSIARTRAKTPRDLSEGMRLVKECLRIIWECQYKTPLKFWVIENPRGYLRMFLGKPAFNFHQWEYGDEGIKPTDLWGRFKEPKKKCFVRPKALSHRFPCGSINAVKWSKSADKRSLCLEGFAKAFFEANR